MSKFWDVAVPQNFVQSNPFLRVSPHGRRPKLDVRQNIAILSKPNGALLQLFSSGFG